MDSGHGNGAGGGGWGSSSFASGPWEQPFPAQDLGFDQGGVGDDNGYSNAAFAIDTPFPGADSQTDASSLPHELFADQRHQSQASHTSQGQFSQGQFSLEDQHSGGDFSAEHQVPADHQAHSSHGFSHGSANGVNSAPIGYSHGAFPWQQQMPTDYNSGLQYGNPLTAPQTSSVSTSVSSGSSPAFFSAQGATPASVPAYQTESHQQGSVTSQPLYSQFSAAPNGPSQQPGSVANLQQVPAQPPVRKATPQQLLQQGRQQMAQQVPQQVSRQMPQQIPQQVPQQAHQQQFSQQVPQHGSQQIPQQVPQQFAEHASHHVAQPLYQQQPIRPQAQQHSQQQQTPQQPAQQPMPQFPLQTTEPSAAAGVKRGPATEPQAAPAVAKKAKVVATGPVNPVAASAAPAAQAQPVAAAAAAPSQPQPSVAPPTQPQTTSAPAPAQAQTTSAAASSQPQTSPASVAPLAAPQNEPEPTITIGHIGSELLTAARDRPGAMWAGVPHLVVGEAAVKLQKGTPTKRYVTLVAKGGKDPLFPELPRGWVPAESLGNHAEAYQRSVQDADRQRADVRLEIEMRRGRSEIPVDWWKKGLKDRLGQEPRRLDVPSEPLYTGIKAAESVRIHPAHRRNEKVVDDARLDFAVLLQTKVNELKALLKPPEKKSVTGQAKTEKPVDDQAEAQIRALRDQLEHALVEAVKVDSADVFPQLSGKNLKVVAGINNVLFLLFKAGEDKPSLVKAILRFYSRLTKLTVAQLEQVKMENVRRLLKKEDDQEAKALIAQVYENARANGNDESESASDSPGAASGARGKKLAPAQPREVSKKTTLGSDLKKPTSTTATSQQAKAMAPNGDRNKSTAKPAQKASASASMGTKRVREDDAAGAEARSTKKTATETPSASSLKTGSAAAKPLTNPASKVPIAKSSTTTAASLSAATQPKPRSGLLLPGKARPAPKPVKAEEQKSAPKLETTLKAQPTKIDYSKLTASKLPPGSASAAAKTTKPKTAEPTKQAAAPSKSIFSSLMKEIDEEKKVIKTPESTAQKPIVPDPNETPQERERRLRKESRRGLRVAFKSGDGLVEIREFTRHPEEIAESNMARNVRTDGRYKNTEESEMMKKLRGGKGLEDLDFADREWEEPIAVDFAAIPQETREKGYTSRGGLKTFETEEQKLIRERESKELMVIYHNPDDIPPTPKSPPYEPFYTAQSLLNPVIRIPNTMPGYEEGARRTAEYKKWGPRYASRAAASRLDGKANTGPALLTDPIPNERRQQYYTVRDPRIWFERVAAAQRDQQTLDLLTSDRVKNWQDPDPDHHELSKLGKFDPEVDKKCEQLFEVFARMAEQQRLENIATKEREQKEKAAREAEAAAQAAQAAAAAAQAPQAAAAPDYTAWAQYYAQQQQHAQYGQHQADPYAAYRQAQAQQPAAHQPTVDPNNQYAAIIAAALGGQQPAAQQQYHAATDPTAQLQALLASQGQQAAAPAPAANDQATQYVQSLLALANYNAAQPQTQPAAQGAYQQQQAHQYAQQQTSQGYGSARPDRDGGYGQGQGQSQGGYGQMYGSGSQDRDSYGRDYDRERDYHERDNRDSREHNRDRDHHHHRGGGSNNNNKGGGGRNGGGSGGKNDGGPDHLRGINRALIGTKACVFWAKGQCAKGDKCTFRHD